MTWLIHMWHAWCIDDTTHSYMTWLICLWHELSHVTCLIHTFTPTHFLINHTHPRAPKHTPHKKIAQSHNAFIFFCPSWQICTHPCIHFFCLGADMDDTVLKETCTVPSYPKGAALCVAWRCCVLKCVAVCCSVLQCVAVCCSVLQCVAVCCSVLQCITVRSGVVQCVASRDLISKAPYCPSNKAYTSSKDTCMSPHMRPIYYQISPSAKISLFAIKLWW